MGEPLVVLALEVVAVPGTVLEKSQNRVADGHDG
jgi:hypothetical protein